MEITPHPYECGRRGAPERPVPKVVDPATGEKTEEPQQVPKKKTSDKRFFLDFLL